jgi:hypothetical protein
MNKKLRKMTKFDIPSLVQHLQTCLTPSKNRKTFGFSRLQQLTDGEWADPGDFLKSCATVRVVRGDDHLPPLQYPSWQRLLARSKGRLPNDAITTLLACNLYKQQHFRRGFAKDFGCLVHNRLLMRAVGHAGQGWECIDASSKEVTTALPIQPTLVQHTFEPFGHPRIPHAVHATIAPAPGHQNPLEQCAYHASNAIWAAMKKARPNLSIVAAEVEAVLPHPTFQTSPGLQKRYLAPRLDAIGVDRDDLVVIDYKTCLGAKPVVWACYVAQLIVGAYCLAMSTNLVPTMCMLVIATRTTVHIIEFPFACQHPFIQDTLHRSIVDTAKLNV